MLLNNPLQPAPTGGIWTTGVGVEEWPRRKIFFAENKKPLVPKEKLTRGDKPIL